MLHYPRMTTVRKVERLKISQRQVQKYLKRLQEAGDIISLNKCGSLRHNGIFISILMRPFFACQYLFEQIVVFWLCIY